MTTLLHLDSSANRSGESLSRQLSALFAENWQAVHGTAGYRHRDLAADPVPPLTTAFCQLGRRVERHGLVPVTKVAGLIENAAEEHEWAITRPLIAELLEADTVLIGAPMYNYSVSGLLKAWIDRVTFPGAFIEPNTGVSLLRDTRFVVTCASGGAYGPGAPQEANDFQIPYLRAYFRRHGVSDANMFFVRAEMTLAGLVNHLAEFRPMAESSLDAARADVRGLMGAAV